MFFILIISFQIPKRKIECANSAACPKVPRRLHWQAARPLDGEQESCEYFLGRWCDVELLSVGDAGGALEEKVCLFCHASVGQTSSPEPCSCSVVASPGLVLKVWAVPPACSVSSLPLSTSSFSRAYCPAPIVCGFSGAWLWPRTSSLVLGSCNMCWSAAPSGQQLPLTQFGWLLSVMPPPRHLPIEWLLLALSSEALQWVPGHSVLLWIVFPRVDFSAGSASVTSQWLQQSWTIFMSFPTRSGF